MCRRRRPGPRSIPIPRGPRSVTRTALNLVRLSAVLAWSIVPTLAGRVLSALGEDAPIPPWPTHAGSDLLLDLHADRPIGPIGPLVAKLDAADIARLSQRFAGVEPERC